MDVDDLHSPVRCSVTRWITRMGSTSCRWMHLAAWFKGHFCKMSVCLSHASIKFVKTVTHILKLFSLSGTHNSSFCTPNGIWQYSNGDHSNASNARWVWKNRDFWPISRFISEIIQDRAIVLWKANRKPHQAFEWYDFQWSWVASNPDFKVTILFNAK